MRPIIVSKHAGFTLLEAMVAMLIMSVGLLGNIALQAVVTKASTKVDSRITATNLVKELHGQMLSNPANLSCYAYPGALALAIGQRP